MARGKVVVIGTGISGLTAAALLAHKGREVVLVDKRSRPGGALKRFWRQGVAFDVGFHYTGGLGQGEILRLLWGYCGILEHLSIHPFPPDSAEKVYFTDAPGHIDAPFSYERIQEELKSRFPGEREGIGHFFDRIRQRAESIPFYSRQGLLAPFFRSLAFPEKESLDDLIRSCTADPQLQTILALPVFLHGVPAHEIGLTLHATVAHLVYSGMYWIAGGGQAIVDGFLATLKNRVEMRTGVQVERIRISGNEVCGLGTSSGTIGATDIIFTGHPADLPGLVPDGILRRAYGNRLRDLRNTGSMFVIFGTLENSHRYQHLTWNNLYRLGTGGNILDPGKSCREKTIFLNSCGFRDIEYKEPMEKRAVMIMRPASWEETARFDSGPGAPRAKGYRAWKEKTAAQMLAAAETIVPGIQDDFRIAALGSPLTFRDELDYPRGAIYGMRHCRDQFPVGAKTRLPGLWLSGQSTMMPGIIGASMAALVTVGEMMGLEELWAEIKACA